MKIAWTTDTHLNFIDQQKGLQFCQTIIDTECDALFITGDIAESHDIVAWLTFLEQQLQRPIYFVLGNHDFYHSTIPDVTQRVTQLCQQSQYLCWMNHAEVLQLGEGITLIGHDGWGDAKYGDFLKTPIRLNDHKLIVDLTGWDRETLKKKLNQLGEIAAVHLKKRFQEAKPISKEIWVLTHVPPFPEACWYQKEWGAPDWIPDFACKSVGDVLLDFSDNNPNIKVNVLCGHGHSPGEVFMRDNLYVRTGGAVYGEPAIEDVLTI